MQKDKGILFWLTALVLLASLPAFYGSGGTFGIKVHIILNNLATVVITYYCFAEMFGSVYIGLACSWLYTMSVFRICKLYVAYDAGELWAMVFFLVVIYGLYSLFTQDIKTVNYRRVWAFCAALMVSAIGFLFFWQEFYQSQMLRSYEETKFIQSKGLYIPQLIFHWWKKGDNALLGDMGMQSAQPIGMGMVLCLGLGVFCALWYAGQLRDQGKHVLILGKISAVLGGLCLVMSLNIFPWDSLQKLNRYFMILIGVLETPTRFLGIGTVFLVIVAGCILWVFDKKVEKKYYYISVILIIAAITTSSMYLLENISYGA